MNQVCDCVLVLFIINLFYKFFTWVAEVPFQDLVVKVLAF